MQKKKKKNELGEGIRLKTYLDSPLACQIFVLPRQAWERQSLVLSLCSKKSVQAGTGLLGTIKMRGQRKKKGFKIEEKTVEREREREREREEEGVILRIEW